MTAFVRGLSAAAGFGAAGFGLRAIARYLAIAIHQPTLLRPRQYVAMIASVVVLATNIATFNALHDRAPLTPYAIVNMTGLFLACFAFWQVDNGLREVERRVRRRVRRRG